MIGIKKAAVALAAGGTALGLIGMGLGASFTDGASATQTIKVGTFGCAISTATQGANVSLNGRTITFNAPDIMSSAAGTSPLDFTVTSIGTIPVDVAITQTAPAWPFNSLLVDSVVTLNPTVPSHAYAAGLTWPELFNSDRGKTVRISYTATCSESPAVPTPIDPKYTTQRPGQLPSGYTAYYSVFLCEYTAGVARITQPTPQTNGPIGIWTNGSSHYYILAYNDHDGWVPPASACPAFVAL